MKKEIEEFLGQLLPELARRGIGVASQRDLLHGLQLRLQRDGQYATLNLYHSDRKGLSKVLCPAPKANGRSNQEDQDLQEELRILCAAEPESAPQFHAWKHWIGSDESGKGDYFGSLVVAAFAVDSQIAQELAGLGVKDSKSLYDNQIKDIAHEIYSRYPDRIACVVIKPLKYNEIIADMQSRQKNLNDLLAWQHSQAIQELLLRHPATQGILVDQFSRAQKVQKLLKSKEVGVPVVERPGAEADLGVAAASVIARYQFLQLHEAMSRHYRMEFPLGASSRVLEPARAFVEKYGLRRLAEVAKLHFVTSRKVQQQEIFSL